MANEEKKQEDVQEPVKWSFSEYTKHERSRGWYFWSFLLATALVVYALLTQNWLFALIIVMISVMIVVNDKNEPQKIEFEIGDDGIRLGNKKIEYKEIKNFWIAYEPPEVKSLYFIFYSSLRPRLMIPLEDVDPIAVRSFLRQYIEEDLDKESETLSDTFGRVTKMQ